MSEYGVVVEDNEDGSLAERPLEVVGSSLPWLDTRLQQEGVAVHPQCALQRAKERTLTLRRESLAGNALPVRSDAELFDFCADAYGADFLSKSLHLGATRGLSLPKARWKDLATGDPVLTRGGQDSFERNRAWESVIASLASSFAPNVTTDEPDVTCEFQGKRFAIAAKMAYSEGNAANAIRKGFEQADGKGDASLVMVNVAGIYPAKASYGLHDFSDGQAGVRFVKPSVDRWIQTFGFESINRRLLQKSSVPIGVTFFVPMFVKVKGMAAVFLYTCLPICWERDAGPDYAFATAFLHACQSVLGFDASPHSEAT